MCCSDALLAQLWKMVLGRFVIDRTVRVITVRLFSYGYCYNEFQLKIYSREKN